MTKIVAIGALGGTIASAPGDGAGAVPTLSAESLAAAVPELAEIADVRARTLATLPSPSLDEPTILAALRWARQAVDEGAAGVVITQGTDTLEEAAYLLDLFWERPEPLVVTGAMRASHQPSADGPANLIAATRTAVDDGSRDRGVLVVFDDAIHQARWVAKTDSVSTGAFRSPVFGPIGRLVENEVVYAAPLGRVAPLMLRSDQELGDPRVPLVATYLGDDGYALRALRPDDIDGVVIAGFGAGHVSPRMADAIEELAQDVPVVFASRTGSGPTGKAMYGYPGSEVDLVRRGAIPAGWLPPVKARLLLWALMLGQPDRQTVVDELARRGTP